MLTIGSYVKIESEVIIDITQAFRQPGYQTHKAQIGLQEPTKADARELYEDQCSVSEMQCRERSHNRLLDDTNFEKLQWTDS